LKENNITILIVIRPVLPVMDCAVIILKSACKSKGFPVNNKASDRDEKVLFTQILIRSGKQCGCIVCSGSIPHQSNPG
jgi:hypothetical protein